VGNKVDNTTEEAIITNSTSVMLTSVASDEYAIGYVSLGSLDDTGLTFCTHNVVDEILCDVACFTFCCDVEWSCNRVCTMQPTPAVNSGAEIEIQESDSTTGMTDAAAGTSDIGMASRELKDSETEQGLTATTIAMDGIAVVVNLDKISEKRPEEFSIRPFCQ